MKLTEIIFERMLLESEKIKFLTKTITNLVTQFKNMSNVLKVLGDNVLKHDNELTDLVAVLQNHAQAINALYATRTGLKGDYDVEFPDINVFKKSGEPN